MNVKIKRIEGGKLPEYKTEGAAGADCFARLLDKENPLRLLPGMSSCVPLGFAVEIPEGYEMQIRGRSGLARKNNIECFPGTIDSDYRGEVCAIIINKGLEPFEVKDGDRIAQAVIAPVIQAKWNEVEELSETERGEGGFGSTGVSEKKESKEQLPKFYEPFKNLEDVEKFLNKPVLIDGEKEGIVTAVKLDDAYGKKVLKIEFALRNGFLLELMPATAAFSRVKVDGHNFGKEIE